MLFKRIDPAENLKRYIECYWIAEDGDTTIREEKIIPDGFTEIIFHFGRPYQIKLDKDWKTQSLSLIAGQIDKHFYLQNTGAASMLAIKFKPAALNQIFGLAMTGLTNKVEEVHKICPSITDLEKQLDFSKHNEAIRLLDDYFSRLTAPLPSGESHAEKALDLIFSTDGVATVSELSGACGISSRHLERIFKHQVGLSPKLFARIIRFNRIFKLIQEENPQWTALAYQSGYYDQSHFIHDFKAFTGEEPSAYIFDENNFANFFLNKD